MNPIASDLIPKGGADVIISMEPMEALRYLPYLSKNGWIITSSTPFVNIPNYPDIEVIKADLQKLPNVIMLDIEEKAKDAGPRKLWASSTRSWRMPSVASSDVRVRLLSRQISRRWQ